MVESEILRPSLRIKDTEGKFSNSKKYRLLTTVLSQTLHVLLTFWPLPQHSNVVYTHLMGKSLSYKLACLVSKLYL